MVLKALLSIPPTTVASNALSPISLSEPPTITELSPLFKLFEPPPVKFSEPNEDNPVPPPINELLPDSKLVRPPTTTESVPDNSLPKPPPMMPLSPANVPDTPPTIELLPNALSVGINLLLGILLR